MRSRVDERRLAVVSIVALLALLVAIPLGVLAQTTSTTFVTGTVTAKDPVTFSSSAVMVVTLVDRSARGDGVILGLQRKADPGGAPTAFKVRYDPSRIDPGHSYVVFAAVIDGSKRWQNPDGVPVITGGPTSGVDVRVKKVSTSPPATIEGELTKKDKTALSNKAVALAAVLDVDTGRTVTWTAITPSGNTPIAFTLGFDPSSVDAGAALVAWGAIVDNPRVWEADGGSPLIAAGSNLSAGSIQVIATTPLPVAPSPTPTPTPVTIPTVRNQPQAKAVQTLEDADLVVGDTKQAYNASIAKGNATKTNPEAGTRVPPRSSVVLVVSKGPSPSPKPTATPKPTPTPVAVPDVRNQPEADAVITLTDVGLKIGGRERRFNEKVAPGNAIKTDPVAGTVVKVGSAVDLFISKGPSPSPSPTPSPTPKPVTVPDVRGMSEPDAIIALTDADLEIGQRLRKIDAAVPAGVVIDTDPGPKSKVAPGTLVDLFVSSGPAPTPTPEPTPEPTPSPSPSGSPAPWPYPTEGPGFLSGSLVYRDAATPGAFRQVVITLLEEQDGGSRIVPTSQYVADGSAPLGFALSFDWAEMNPTASYRVLAAIVDGDQSWYSLDGAAAITDGAPITGLLVPLFQRGDILEGQVTGVIVGVDADLSEAAIREVFLVRSDTGEVISFDSAPASTQTRVQAFAVPFLLDDIDPDAEYLVVARVIDGPRVWTGPGVPAITHGNPFRVVVPVTPISGEEPQLDPAGS